MAINIRETFEVRAPIEEVWRFVMDPEQVVTCMPGATLEEVVDERTFLGSIEIKVGAVTTSYKGKISLTEVDEQQFTVRMSAEGRETGGGTARGSMSSRLVALEDGKTEVVAEASIDLTGRIMQVGRGMIEGVSHQLFLQFIARVKARLETPAASDTAAEPAVAESEPIRLVPLVFGVIRTSIGRFFRRLFGGPSS